MGYHVQSADQVYRYIFRIGAHRRGGLSDGFSWSILFLNDTSPACAEFLSRFGAELCHRTADRIRFVFFSGLNGHELQHIAEQGNRGGGFLERIFSTIGEGTFLRRRYGWERSPWEAFRPEPFYPLDTHERVEHQLSWEYQLNSAMPGSEKALRLAQRLGIGRFVPCFLLFADLGNPTVCLFPIARETPEQVFKRLRMWIDSFYEINGHLIERWREIEQRIKDTCDALRMSVRQVENWSSGRKARWQSLQRLTAHIRTLTDGPAIVAAAKAISSDWDLP